MPKSGLTTKAEGYGWTHQVARRRLIAELTLAGVGQCCRCGGAIYPEQARLLDADHWQSRKPDQPDALAHRSCNRVAGAREGNRRRGVGRVVPLPEW